jgi:tetratricopeptide (TPR) repeat protein
MSDSNMNIDLLQKPLPQVFLIVAICLIANSNTLNAPFQFDDSAAIVDNPIVKDLGYMLNPAAAKVHKQLFEYELFNRRYIGYLTFALNYRLHRLDTAGYHVVNLYIHIINALIVYWLVMLTVRTPFLSSSTLRAHSSQIALFTSLLFACHPVQTQAVTYIWQRVTILAATFYLLSLAMYIKWRLTSKKTGPFYHGMPLLFYLGALVSAVLAMKTKEIAFTLPVVILLYELMFFDGKLKQRFLYLVPLFLTMFIIPLSLLGTDMPIGELISDVSEATRVHTSISRWDYLLTQFAVIVTYIRLIFLPVNQNLDYDYPIYNTFLTPEIFLSFLLLFCIFGLGVYLFWYSRARNSAYRLIAFGIFWFFITLSVESSFIPLMNVIFEHRIYLPSVGFFIVLTTGVFLLFNKFGQRKLRAIGIAGFTIVIIVLSVFTYARNNVWSSKIALWQDCVEKSPKKARPHSNLGVALDKQGRTEEAIEHYLQALRIKPDYVDAHNNLGLALYNQGRTEEAMEHYLQALRIKPDYEKAHNNLGNALDNQGRTAEAIEHYLQALRIKPDLEEVHYNLGNTLDNQGRTEEAIEHYLQALRIKPDYVEAHNNLAIALFRKGDIEGAIAHFRKALRINPGDVGAKNNLKKALMMQQQKQ